MTAKKKREVKLWEVLEAVNTGFTEMENRFSGIENRLDRLEVKVDGHTTILEKHSAILKRLDEERIFTLSYVKRLENDINRIKAHLKIA